MAHVNVLATVSLPAEIITIPSSDMRITDFSSGGNLLDRISSKIVRGRCEGFLSLLRDDLAGSLSVAVAPRFSMASCARARVS